MSFDKQAFWAQVGQTVATALAQPQNQARLAVAAGVGVYGLGRMAVERHQTGSSYNQMLELYPQLKREDAQRVKLYFDTIQQSAPGIARQPLVAGSVVSRLLNYDGFDHQTYKDLLSAQSVINGNSGHFGEQLMGLNKGLMTLASLR